MMPEIKRENKGRSVRGTFAWVLLFSFWAKYISIYIKDKEKREREKKKEKTRIDTQEKGWKIGRKAC